MTLVKEEIGYNGFLKYCNITDVIYISLKVDNILDYRMLKVEM